MDRIRELLKAAAVHADETPARAAARDPVLVSLS
jgi:hypothetical protein